MKSTEHILFFLARNASLFRERFHIIKIGIFGSYASGEQTVDSDLDLLVEFEENTQNLYELKMQLREFFRVELGIEIDICREKYIKPRVREMILQEVVYAGSG